MYTRTNQIPCCATSISGHSTALLTGIHNQYLVNILYTYDGRHKLATRKQYIKQSQVNMGAAKIIMFVSK